jgi:hypothetical protein
MRVAAADLEMAKNDNDNMDTKSVKLTDTKTLKVKKKSNSSSRSSRLKPGAKMGMGEALRESLKDGIMSKFMPKTRRNSNVSFISNNIGGRKKTKKKEKAA